MTLVSGEAVVQGPHAASPADSVSSIDLRASLKAGSEQPDGKGPAGAAALSGGWPSVGLGMIAAIAESLCAAYASGFMPLATQQALSALFPTFSYLSLSCCWKTEDSSDSRGVLVTMANLLEAGPAMIAFDAWDNTAVGNSLSQRQPTVVYSPFGDQCDLCDPVLAGCNQCICLPFRMGAIVEQPGEEAETWSALIGGVLRGYEATDRDRQLLRTLGEQCAERGLPARARQVFASLEQETSGVATLPTLGNVSWAGGASGGDGALPGEQSTAGLPGYYDWSSDGHGDYSDEVYYEEEEEGSEEREVHFGGVEGGSPGDARERAARALQGCRPRTPDGDGGGGGGCSPALSLVASGLSGADNGGAESEGPDGALREKRQRRPHASDGGKEEELGPGGGSSNASAAAAALGGGGSNSSSSTPSLLAASAAASAAPSSSDPSSSSDPCSGSSNGEARGSASGSEGETSDGALAGSCASGLQGDTSDAALASGSGEVGESEQGDEGEDKGRMAADARRMTSWLRFPTAWVEEMYAQHWQFSRTTLDLVAAPMVVLLLAMLMRDAGVLMPLPFVLAAALFAPSWLKLIAPTWHPRNRDWLFQLQQVLCTLASIVHTLLLVAGNGPVSAAADRGRGLLALWRLCGAATMFHVTLVYQIRWCKQLPAQLLCLAMHLAANAMRVPFSPSVADPATVWELQAVLLSSFLAQQVLLYVLEWHSRSAFARSLHATRAGGGAS